MENIHKPIMVKEVLQCLNLRSGAIYVDTTVGDGGHSLAILEGGCEDIAIIALDRDPDAIKRASERLDDYSSSIKFFNVNFTDIDKVVEEEVDGILFDLGVSTYQVMTPERGFSFGREGPLDMGMGVGSKSAGEFINTATETEISQLLYEYGGERFSRRIAKAIVKGRPFETTKELAEIIEGVYPEGYRRIHPATRTFQALRIWANDEIENIEIAMEKASKIIKRKGNIVILSYHILEHLTVEKSFKKLSKTKKFDWYYRRKRPTQRERSSNNRSRSAKLSALKRVR